MRANTLFRQGSALFAKGKYQAALSLLEQAHRLYPSHKIVVSIGYTLEQLGRAPEAAQSFERFLADPASGGNPRVRGEVERKLRRLKQTLSRLSLSHGVTGDLLLLDGKEVARTPLPHPLYLHPGNHRVAVRRGARSLFEQALSLEAGEHRLVTVSLETTASTGALPRSRERPTRRTPLLKRWWLWAALGGVVVSAVVVGAVAATSGGSDRLPTGSLGAMDFTQ